jgi:RNA-directed DNA polymerase
VRRVEIPKPGGKGIRLLGVPTVRDRVVHATLERLLEPICEPLFSDHSYGFRPERNQGQAVEAARTIVAGGKPYLVDLDLSKFLIESTTTGRSHAWVKAYPTSASCAWSE